MTKIVWRLTDFTWWESDTPRKWPANSFQYAEWLDIRKHPWEIRLSWALTDTWWTFADDICFMEDIEKYWGSWVVVATEDWKIYLDWVEQYTINTWTTVWNQIIGMAYMNISWTDYLYFITRASSWTAQIHRVTIDFNPANWSISHLTINTTSWNFDKAPTISEATRIIFALWGKVFDIDIAETLTTKLEFSENDYIVAMTEFQNQYRIYSNIEDLDTYQYFWDWTSEDFDYKVKWKHLPIRAIENDWGYDYWITWFNQYYSDLYQIAGSQRQELRVNLEASTNARELNEHISSREWIFYISWARNWTYWVYTYGNYFPWYSQSLVLEHPHPTDDRILWHTHIASESYFAAADNKVYVLNHNNPSSNLNTTWYIESLVWNGWAWNQFIKKSIDYAYVWFDDATWTESINIYARANGWAYKLLKTISNNSEQWVRIDKTEFQSIWLWDFFDLEYKIVLNWDWWGTPIFRGIETYITTWVKK